MILTETVIRGYTATLTEKEAAGLRGLAEAYLFGRGSDSSLSEFSKALIKSIDDAKEG